MTTNYKTFKDLEFENKYQSLEILSLLMSCYRNFRTPKRARLNFENGYGISVITGAGSYTDNENEYEIAVLKNNNICYSTSITNDVIGHLSSQEVTDIMKQIQELPNIDNQEVEE